jgi:hypothetical protein
VFWYAREFVRVALSLSPREYDVAFFHGPPKGRKNKNKKKESFTTLFRGSKTEVLVSLPLFEVYV